MSIKSTRTHSGIFLETIYNNQYYHKLYIGYSLRESKKLFREYVMGKDSKIFYNQ
jgi:hypothetical protein